MKNKNFLHLNKYILWAYAVFEVIMVWLDSKYGIFLSTPPVLAWAVIISSFLFVALFLKTAGKITKQEREASTGAALILIICMLIYVKVMFT